MYSPFRLAIKYIRYYLLASNRRGHGIHSPFVFEFVRSVLNDDADYPEYKQIEKYRAILLRNNSLLPVTDFGAGSGHSNNNERTVREIARHALKSPKYASLLFRMVRTYSPAIIAELGTSLGTTSAYLALADPKATVYTFEGSPAIGAEAGKLFDQLHIKNITQVAGNFDETLPPVLDKINKADFIFLDGNHRYEPTVEYFTKFLPVMHQYSILVMDDIHWSREMERAWDHCRKHPAVTLSIDLFFIGILFFRKDFHIAQHFTIRF
jgi:predicted O-methyltransferase YrrM